MRFMMLLKSNEDAMKANPPSGEFMAAMGRFIQEGVQSGTLIQTGGLQESTRGARARLSRGKISVVDGPFTEAKEVIGGYAVIQAESKQQAVEAASRLLQVHRDGWAGWEGEVEIRAISEVPEANGGSSEQVDQLRAVAAKQ